MLAQVLAAVAARAPVDVREARSLERFLADVPRLAAPFDRDADPRHVTAAAVVVGGRGVVLHCHKRLGRWLQPGGHVEPGETPWEAARREAREETGLAASHPMTGPTLLHVDVHPGPGGHVRYDLRYLLHGPDEDPAPAPGESPEARWFTWDDSAALADEGPAGALAAAAEISRPGGPGRSWPRSGGRP